MAVNLVERIRSKVVVHHAQVVAVHQFGASMVQVQVRCDGLSVESGAHFALAVDGSGALVSSVWRRFTVSGVSSDDSSFTWLAFGAGDRSAATWHRRVRPGDVVSIRSFDRPTRPPIAPAVWVGDETAIGSFAAFIVGGSEAVRVVLCTADERDAVVPGLSPGAVNHVSSVDAAVVQFRRIVGAVPGTDVHVAGNRELVTAIRSAVDDAGIARANLAARTYWAPGKRGME